MKYNVGTKKCVCATLTLSYIELNAVIHSDL